MIKKNNSFKRNRPKPIKRNGLNGFDNKILKQKPRGNPLEVKIKYESLAKDASSAGDKVAAENYMQHAEHFLRVNNSIKKTE
ncbi:MAG: hypothetical protein CMP36_01815 [Rickettsiales bacterium]|nr:hypothetical protein [Rickettsiales bacterium]OUV81428.1 MAG: hypothetical protein CBC91_02315 [Rickettsiales bacterium TMED131]|tara:strand:+ start:1038 stop:1283 length:246 start_codon:yes stop_codon:yes gene_type:complete